jgi:hypothetical protein
LLASSRHPIRLVFRVSVGHRDAPNMRKAYK